MGLGAVPCFNIRVCAGKTRNRKTDDDLAGGRRCCIYFSNYITQRRLFLFCLLFFELVPSFLSLSRRSYRDAVFIVPVCARWWTFLIPFIIQHVRNTAETIYERKKIGSQPITARVLYWPCHLSSRGFAHRNFITPRSQRASDRSLSASQKPSRLQRQLQVWRMRKYTCHLVISLRKGKKGKRTRRLRLIHILAVPRARRNHSLYIVFRE
jgi:hypothetical protein